MATHNTSGVLVADIISLTISLSSVGLAVFGHMAEQLQLIAYVVSITAGLFTIVFGYLNYKLNKKKNKDANETKH